ncbi:MULTISPECIES: LemA family protein [Draconibacterium]|uniref:LemA family protein n=1 Tax=Draconibacterium sediminis TaxID=1544798 RepID=A0A0D8JDK6_9BACT|nr:LemA family protein [Draconibacterium sediminis]KJF44681.1 LemA family protein [Draconibacterium sediminis]
MKRFRIVLIALVSVVLFSSCGYNKMVEMDEQVTASWAQVENVYQRRADLIPNLVNTVKGYAEHEQETLTGVIEARSKATSVNIDPANLNPQTIQQFNQAQEGLSSALSKLMVVVERYPDLKANQNFMELQAQLEGTENRIAVERRKFNQTTQSYNAYIRKFPRVIYAGWFGFEKKTYFEAQQGAEQAPEVQF